VPFPRFLIFVFSINNKVIKRISVYLPAMSFYNRVSMFYNGVKMEQEQIKRLDSGYGENREVNTL